uniref:Fe2OG dioxygenase domain-containing protein n=1 Tax=viral metagenome TaxID=1070528 RepID=A0A6C0KEH1_9ZZZZ
MKHSNISYLYWCLFFALIIIFCVGIYGYNSGSCKINKKYICNDNFCLYKEFKIFLQDVVKNEINHMLDNKKIQKRVNIVTYPETILNCAIPNKRGITISAMNIKKYAPKLIQFYENKLCALVSKKLNLKLFPTDLNLPTSCAILIYENEGDWINWHYDHNYYDGRFFTLLIPITNNLTCTEFQFKNDNNEVKSIQLIDNKSICFEGNYLYHRASKLCKNEKRVMLSCQYVTNNNMNFINKLRLKIKDFAYMGQLGF